MTFPRAARVPGSTYRLQLNKDFTFKQALDSVEYWHSLGITDLYAAPFFVARAGSVHGYDVVDHRAINPEIGTEEDLAHLNDALKARGMGLIMDLVPNHMCVNTNDNVWWNDVLENGPSSPYARYFDIDWRPPKTELKDKVLLPVLGEQYGKVLENAELQLAEAGGALSVWYHERGFPIGPGTYPEVLDGALRRLRAAPSTDESAIALLESLIAFARRLPLRSELEAEKVLERQKAKEIVKGRLQAVLAAHPAARRALDEELVAINGSKGAPRTFDALESLLAKQAYRLSFWKVAAEHINYRRFFEVNDLAAIRVEEPEVLEAVHAKAFELLERGWIAGLRIDHVDGLREPKQYLDDVARRARAPYVVVEKILCGDERLPPAWATEGTTGYEFLNLVNGLFVAPSGESPLRAHYDGLRTVRGSFADVVYDAKRLIVQSSMSSELSVLARRLDRISEQHRWSRDFTIGTLQQVLVTTIACFPVYRTYVAAGDVEVGPQDAASIRTALAAAKHRTPSLNASSFDFLGDVLLMQDPEGLSDAQRAERRDFIMRFQQLTGPVIAKGVEDTAFFRYFPLLSLNEVGGGPSLFGIAVGEFHQRMKDRAVRCPGALSATTTHDTKRAEDNRARLDVISEIPGEWIAASTEWSEMAAPLKPQVNGRPVPDADDEYYVYQTIVGAWPPGGLEDPTYAGLTERVQGAVEKAVREAKRNTSWVNPNADYEDALRSFVARLLDREGPVARQIGAFASRILVPGLLNSLAQLVIKATAPGVPDFYQGTELWDFSMVDPDNRRPVDFVKRRRLLGELLRLRGSEKANLGPELLRVADDGRVKLYVTSALLACRRQERDLFAHGTYIPLVVEGERKDNVVAFARRWQKRLALTVTGRFFTQVDGARMPWRTAWADTVVRLPPELASGKLTDIFSGATMRGGRPSGASTPGSGGPGAKSPGSIHQGAGSWESSDAAGSLRVADLLERMPFTVLLGEAVADGTDAPQDSSAGIRFA